MVKRKQRRVSARRLAIEAAGTAHDRHCKDIVVLDLRGISPVTDVFVILTGTSGRQMGAVAAEIVGAAAAAGHKVFNVSGLNSGKWILLDFVDVVVHIFDDRHRHYYDLELIWGDAPRLDWRRSRRRTGRPARGDDDEA